MAKKLVQSAPPANQHWNECIHPFGKHVESYSINIIVSKGDTKVSDMWRMIVTPECSCIVGSRGTAKIGSLLKRPQQFT
jgi:hypothetical protein